MAFCAAAHAFAPAPDCVSERAPGGPVAATAPLFNCENRRFLTVIAGLHLLLVSASFRRPAATAQIFSCEADCEFSASPSPHLFVVRRRQRPGRRQAEDGRIRSATRRDLARFRGDAGAQRPERRAVAGRAGGDRRKVAPISTFVGHLQTPTSKQARLPYYLINR